MQEVAPVFPEILLSKYTLSSILLTNFLKEKEGQKYHASRFQLFDKKCIYRHAKITPKKTGQFVTFWNRNTEGNTIPFHSDDMFDFFIISTMSKNKIGQFIFPKAILEEKNIISTIQKEGKRGFRIYPSWDKPRNQRAIETQNWQLSYFYEFDTDADLKKIFEQDYEAPC